MAVADQLVNILFTTPALTALAEANDNAGILAAVNLKDRQRTNTELQTINAIVLALGEQAAGIAAGVLKTAASQNPLLDAIYIKLCSTGISFADARTQTIIDLIFTGQVPIGLDGEGQPVMFDLGPLGQGIKAMGIWQESMADQAFGGAVTSQNVVDAMALYVRRKLEIQVAGRYNQVVAMVVAGEITDWTAARIAMGAE